MHKPLPITKERIGWIDVSRGIAFLAVIYSHLLTSCEALYVEEIDILFRPMFLTTFFFVSGYLYKVGQPFSVVFEHRTRTLLWPLLSLGTLMIIMQHILTLRDSPITWEAGFLGLFLQNGENQILWFVAALYIYSIGFYWIEFYCHDKILYASILLFVLNWIYGYIFNGPDLPWSITGMGYGCAYMGLGRWYRVNEWRFRSLKVATMFFLLVVYSCTILIVGDAPSYFASKYLIDASILTVLGIALTVSLSKWAVLNNNKLLKFIGANSLFYFAFHGKVLGLLTTLIMLLLKGVYLNLFVTCVVGLICTFLCAIILIIPAIIVNRYMPWLLGKNFKLW